MNINETILILLSILAKYCFGKSYNNDYPHRYNQQIHHRFVARLNETDAAAIFAVLQKEPKFFDEFECE